MPRAYAGAGSEICVLLYGAGMSTEDERDCRCGRSLLLSFVGALVGDAGAVSATMAQEHELFFCLCFRYFLWELWRYPPFLSCCCHPHNNTWLE